MSLETGNYIITSRSTEGGLGPYGHSEGPLTKVVALPSAVDKPVVSASSYLSFYRCVLADRILNLAVEAHESRRGTLYDHSGWRCRHRAEGIIVPL